MQGRTTLLQLQAPEGVTQDRGNVGPTHHAAARASHLRPRWDGRERQREENVGGEVKVGRSMPDICAPAMMMIGILIWARSRLPRGHHHDMRCRLHRIGGQRGHT